MRIDWDRLRRVAIATSLWPGVVGAGGFEKNNLFSARHTGLGSAAVASVLGSDALYFNPAGLPATDTSASLHLASGLLSKAAPLTTSGESESSKRSVIPVAGVFGSMPLTGSWAFGLGVYAAGGSGGDYGAVDFGAPFAGFTPELSSTFVILETAMGIAYRFESGLAIGVAWRPTFFSASLNAASRLDLDGDGSPDVLLAPRIAGANDWAWEGLRFGGQFLGEAMRWGLGASLRTEQSFTADGTVTGNALLAGSDQSLAIAGADIALGARFPMQISFGGFVGAPESFRILGEYAWTQYSRNESLPVTGAPIDAGPLGVFPAETLAVPLAWNDQHTVRAGIALPFPSAWQSRIGYSLSTAVVPTERASPFFSPPGLEHAFSLGAGGRIGRRFVLDMAAETTRIAGEVPTTTLTALSGSYRASALGLFVSLTYSFEEARTP